MSTPKNEQELIQKLEEKFVEMQILIEGFFKEMNTLTSFNRIEEYMRENTNSIITNQYKVIMDSSLETALEEFNEALPVNQKMLCINEGPSRLVQHLARQEKEEGFLKSDFAAALLHERSPFSLISSSELKKVAVLTHTYPTIYTEPPLYGYKSAISIDFSRDDIGETYKFPLVKLPVQQDHRRPERISYCALLHIFEIACKHNIKYVFTRHYDPYESLIITLSKNIFKDFLDSKDSAELSDQNIYLCNIHGFKKEIGYKNVPNYLKQWEDSENILNVDAVNKTLGKLPSLYSIAVNKPKTLSYLFNRM